MAQKKSLLDAYRFPGCRPRATIKGIFGDPQARIIQLERRQKKRWAGVAGLCTEVRTTASHVWSGTSHAGMRGFTWKWRCGAFPAGGAAR
ncbi:MAG: hypothetical protein MRJ67_08195 [Nitrospirales bacterium]|nr:hypothetical protein [Nitrospirales bacterium]